MRATRATEQRTIGWSRAVNPGTLIVDSLITPRYGRFHVIAMCFFVPRSDRAVSECNPWRPCRYATAGPIRKANGEGVSVAIRTATSRISLTAEVVVTLI